MKRVLVVDAVASSRCSIATELVQRGYDVATAADVPCALRLAEVARPHLVVLDHELPEALGLVLALERMPGGSIPVVLVRSSHLADAFDDADVGDLAAAS